MKDAPEVLEDEREESARRAQPGRALHRRNMQVRVRSSRNPLSR